METLPATTAFDLSPANVELLKNTIARGATDAEFDLFLGYCRSTGLNPFRKEIWFIKTGNQLQLMTGINGFYAIANASPQFDGLEVETIDDERGQLVKCICRVYRKDRARPTTAEAYFTEYGKQHGTWKSMPRLMLSKCAEAMALRKSFPQQLNGLYSAEEMPAEFAAPDARIEAVPTANSAEEKRGRGRPAAPKWELLDAGKTCMYKLDKMSEAQLKWFRDERLLPAIAAGIEYFESGGLLQIACKFLPAAKLDEFILVEPSRETCNDAARN